MVIAGRRASYQEGISFGLLSFVSVAVLALASSISAARIYGIDVIGSYALAVAPATMLGTLSTAGEQVALVRELSTLEPRAPRVTSLFAAVYAFSSALTVAVAVALAGVAYAVYRGPVGHPEVFAPALALIGAYVVVHNLNWNLDMVFAGFRAGRQLFWIRLSQPLSYTVLVIAAGLVSTSLWAITLATAASWLVALVARITAVRRFMDFGISRAEFREGFDALPHLVRWGLRLTPWGAANGIGTEIGVWVVGSVAPISAVGAYSRAWLLGSRFFDLTSRVNEMLYPTLVERRVAGDVAGSDRATVNTLRYAIAGLLLPAAAGGGAAEGAMAIFGDGFDQGASALAFVLVAPVLATVSGIQAQVLFSFDRPFAVSGIAVARLATIGSLTVALTMAFGITGTAVALVLGYGLDAALGFALVRRCLSERLSTMWPPREAVALLVAYAVGFATARMIDGVVDGVAGTLAALAGGTMTYALVVIVGALNAGERRALSSRLSPRWRTRA